MRCNGRVKFPRRFMIKVATMNFCRSRKVEQNSAKVYNRYALYLRLLAKISKSFLRVADNRQDGEQK